ncbi:hypothetical protein BDZ91DRAFT_764723 [Kalaharituber pfeilii]|nr:hypothetical protein BDZ91DRAFT_764723 [Kalaharituber pfeilii]
MFAKPGNHRPPEGAGQPSSIIRLPKGLNSDPQFYTQYVAKLTKRLTATLSAVRLPVGRRVTASTSCTPTAPFAVKRAAAFLTACWRASSTFAVWYPVNWHHSVALPHRIACLQ